LNAVIRAGIDGEQVGQRPRDGPPCLGLNLLDGEAPPALVAIVRHGPRGARPDHLDAVAVRDEQLSQRLSVAVAMGGALPVRDGAAEGHEAQGREPLHACLSMAG